MKLRMCVIPGMSRKNLDKESLETENPAGVAPRCEESKTWLRGSISETFLASSLSLRGQTGASQCSASQRAR